LPASQVFGILPELKIRLNRSTYNAKNISGVDFMNSFLLISSPDALSLFIYGLFELLKLKKNKLFCAFIDFEKAFDTVWRDGLWYKLFMCNIKGKMCNVI
jgi:hypothetical protein